MKTVCAPDNIACIFDKLVSNPMAILASFDIITLVCIWIGVALIGAYSLTRN